MPSVRSMLDRVRKLEQAGKPRPCPFACAYGSLDAFEAQVRAQIAAGQLDAEADFLVVCARKWDKQGVWALWHRDRIWEMGR